MKVIYNKSYFPTGKEIENEILDAIFDAKETNKDIKEIVLDESDFKEFNKYLLNSYSIPEDKFKFLFSNTIIFNNTSITKG